MIIRRSLSAFHGKLLETGRLAFHHTSAATLEETVLRRPQMPDRRGAGTRAHCAGGLAEAPCLDRPGLKIRFRPFYVASPLTAIAATLAGAVANPVPFAGIRRTLHLDPFEGAYKTPATLDACRIILQSQDGNWTGSLQFLILVGKVELLTAIQLNLSESVYGKVGKLTGGSRDIPYGLVGAVLVPL